MALPIRDGNQSLTTLSTILISNSHIPAHTVVSFGTQGITDIATAVSGVELGPNTLNALENITVTLGQVTITGGLTDAQLRASAVTIGGSVTVGSIVTHGVTIANSSVTIGGSVTATISGTPSVTFTQITTHGVTIANNSVTVNGTFYQATQPVSLATLPALVASTAQIGSVTASLASGQTVYVANPPSPLARLGVQLVDSTGTGNYGTDGSALKVSGTVTIGAGTAQIGSVTASISNSLTISSLPAISGTVTANVLGTSQNGIAYSLPIAVNDSAVITRGVAIGFNDTDDSTFYNVSKLHPLPISTPYGVTIPNSVTIGSLPAISGTVTANLRLNELPYIKANIAITKTGSSILTANVFMRRIGQYKYESVSGWAGGEDEAYIEMELKASGGDQFYWQVQLLGSRPDWTGNFAYALPQGTAGAGNNIGSALPPATWTPSTGFTGTMTVSYEQPSTQIISGTVTLGTGTQQIGSVRVDNTVTIVNIQGTSVETSNFISTTPSTIIAGFNAGREVLTIFNEGAGNLHISVGTTCTTQAYQVRLSTGDYYEAPLNQASITHSAVFASAGTARVTQVS
jgi:hypothetical protein